jgi:hypothetical protein
MCKNIVEPETPQVTIWRMRFGRWIPMATNTLSEYVIVIALLQQWLHVRASVLRYAFIACFIPLLD